MVKTEIVEYFGYPAEQIHVVYNGVPPALSLDDSAKARAEVRQELGLQEHDYVVLFAGSGWERNGLRYAVEAINEAAVAKPVLLVAGSGKKRAMPNSERTRYLGPVPGLSRYLAAADAFILPTIYDPFSNASLEAMAAGLPVITTTANGFAEILEDGVEGDVVTEPSDVLALAQAIERWGSLERRQAVYARLREKGAQFSMERNVNETLTVLETLRPTAPSVAEESAAE
jgi:UDP-glucose:(heptosyl)LPS alpha-1,3-glucosyltransferase